ANLPHGLLGKPDGAIRSDNKPLRLALRGGGGVLGDRTAGRDAPDRVSVQVCIPERAIRPRDDRHRIAYVREARNTAVVNRNVELGELAVSRDAADPVAGEFGKPERAVGTDGDVERLAAGREIGGRTASSRGGQRELGDRADGRRWRGITGGDDSP